jgi:hypothetical protein
LGLQAAAEYIYVAHPEGRRASAKLRAFAECLKEAFGDPPYWDAWSHPGEFVPLAQQRNL